MKFVKLTILVLYCVSSMGLLLYIANIGVIEGGGWPNIINNISEHIKTEFNKD